MAKSTSIRPATEPWWSPVLDAQGAVVITAALDAPAIASVQARVDALVEVARPILASGGVKQAVLGDGITVDPSGGTTYIIVTLCEFTESNGSLRVVPGSHREHPDRFVARGPSARHPRQQVLSAPPGSALVFSGDMLHSGTKNTSDAPRPGLQALFV